MNMSIPKMNKNAVFIKNFTFRLRNISYHTKRCGSAGFPKGNSGVQPPVQSRSLSGQVLYHAPRTAQHLEQRSLGS